MKKYSFLIITFIIAFLPPAFAETEDPTEVYTDASAPASDQHKPSDFHGLLGAALFSGQRIIGDDGWRAGLFPLILIRYKDLAYWNIGGGGVWLLQNDDHSLRFGAGVRFVGGWKANDDAELAGMENRRSSLDGYLNGLWRTPVVTIGASYYHDLGNASRSDAASLRLSHNFRITDDFRLTPRIGAVWTAGERVDYYYGVTPEEALPTRPAYTGRETINYNAGMAGGYRLSPSWSLLGGVFTTRFGNGIVDSPIVSRRWSTLVFFGAGWRF
jgi:outer membrane protein